MIFEMMLSMNELFTMAGFEMKKLDTAVPLSLWKEKDKDGNEARSHAVSYYGKMPEPLKKEGRTFVDFAGGVLVWEWEAQILLKRKIYKAFMED